MTCRLEQKREIYDLPLEIAIKTAAGVRTERILLRDQKAELVFTLAERPIEVLLDPNERILMKKITAGAGASAAKD